MFLIIKEHLTNDELDNTQLEEICDKYLKQFDKKYLNNNFKINELFSLPKDYLERIPDLKKDSYIGPIKDYVKSQGNTSFEQLINLLSESECIENTITTKETLAYRLTGIKLSEKIIEHIKWKQDPMYLYYIIKHFYGKVDGKYIKISNFFLDKDSNPIKVNSPSSYVERLGEKIQI